MMGDMYLQGSELNCFKLLSILQAIGQPNKVKDSDHL